MRRFVLLGCVMYALGITGCASSAKELRLCAESGEVVKLRLNDRINSSMENAGNNLSISVSKFEDKRPPSKHLGSHICRFAGDSYFDLTSGNLEKGVSNTFRAFLKQSGFQVGSENKETMDINIAGKIHKFSAKATRHLFSTNAQVDIVTEFTIANKADGSTVYMTIRAGGTNDMLFFSHEDVEALVNDILLESFEKLLERTEVKGKTLRQKI